MRRPTRRQVREYVIYGAIAVVLAYIGVLVVDAVISNVQERDTANQAISAAQTATAGRNAASVRFTMRIDGLQHQLGKVESQLESNSRKAARQRAALQVEVEALTHQLAALGVAPVVPVAPGAPPVEPVPRPTAARSSSRPRPRVTVTRTAPARPSRAPTSKAPAPNPSATTPGDCLLFICL